MDSGTVGKAGIRNRMRDIDHCAGSADDALDPQLQFGLTPPLLSRGLHSACALDPHVGMTVNEDVGNSGIAHSFAERSIAIDGVCDLGERRGHIVHRVGLRDDRSQRESTSRHVEIGQLGAAHHFVEQSLHALANAE